MGTQTAPTRICIADHDAEARQALRLVCQESLGLMCTAEAASSTELLDLLLHYQPDLLLLEWELPGMPSAALMAAIHARHVQVIIVLGSRPEMRAAACEAGASEFVYKGDPPEVLIHRLRTWIAPDAP